MLRLEPLLQHLAPRAAPALPSRATTTTSSSGPRVDGEEVAQTTKWWQDETAGGGKGMAVKPLDFVTRAERGIASPALKCRGREYLRIIYGRITRARPR